MGTFVFHFVWGSVGYLESCGSPIVAIIPLQNILYALQTKGIPVREAESHPHKDKHDKNLNQEEPYSDPQPTTAVASVSL